MSLDDVGVGAHGLPGSANPKGGHQEPPNNRNGPDPASELIRALAGLFPAAIVAERWRPHRPFKIGISKDLVGTQLMKLGEVGPVMRRLTNRRMYLLACVEGAERIDLDGNPAGVVTASEAQWAAIKLAALDGKRAADAVAVRAARQAARPRRTWKIEADQPQRPAKAAASKARPKVAERPNGATPHPAPHHGITPPRPPAPAETTTPPKRLGLSGLRDAWRQRQAAAQA